MSQFAGLFIVDVRGVDVGSRGSLQVYRLVCLLYFGVVCYWGGMSLPF